MDAYVTDKHAYVQDKLFTLFNSTGRWHLLPAYRPACALQWDDYDLVDWDRVLKGELVANAYVLRKGLIRKAQMAFYLRKYYVKKEGSVLRAALPETLILELSLHSLHGPSMDEAKDALMEGGTWILKPSVVDKARLPAHLPSPPQAAAVSIVRSYKQLKEELKVHMDIREWVLQAYIDRPLLISGYKFHVRTYVVAVGALQVYVHDHMLALLAHRPYSSSSLDRLAHITNTCAQQDEGAFLEAHSVRTLDEVAPELGPERVQDLKRQIRAIVADTFAALSGESSVFMALPNCFELYGFDFLADEAGQCYLLEANAGPDLKNTGDRLDYVIVTLLQGMVDLLEKSLFLPAGPAPGPPFVGPLQRVLDLPQRTWGRPNLNLKD